MDPLKESSGPQWSVDIAGLDHWFLFPQDQKLDLD